jgi:hypothetical protein
MAIPPSGDDFNAARRLYEILAAARKQDGARPAREVWAHVFNLADSNRAEIFRALAQLSDLVEEVMASMSTIPNVQTELYTQYLPAIHKAIGIMQLEGAWEAHLRLLSEVAVNNLLFCSERLRQVYPEQRLTPDVLSELSREVDSLADDVMKADIDPELRRVLLACLESFRRAIAEYRIRGVDGLRDAAAKTIGELLIVRDKIDSKATTLARRFVDLVKKVQVVMEVAKVYPPLADAIRFALEAFGIVSGDDPKI